MNRAWRVAVGATIVLGVGGNYAVALPLSADFAVTTDSEGGVALDAGLSVSPSEHFSLSLGAGHSSASAQTADLQGTLLNAAAALYGERAGVALGYDLFDDDTNYHAATLGARAWVRAGDFEFTLFGRRRDLGVELTLDLPLRVARREMEFSATGGGLQVAYTRNGFSAYAMAIEYDYDEDFDQFLDLADSPLLERRPRIEALLGSFLTQAQGAIDRQAGCGVEYSFGRSSLALDLAAVHDAVLDASGSSVALTYRRAQSVHVDWTLSTGMADSNTYGVIAFMGVGIGLAN